MNNRKKMYRVYSTWQMDGFDDIEAWSQEDAEQKVGGLPLPDNGQYADGSHEIVDSVELETPEDVEMKLSKTKDANL